MPQWRDFESEKRQMSTPANRKTIDRLRQFAEALEDGVPITDKFTCKKVVLNLQPQPYSPDRVRLARTALNVSQALFAEFLGVSTATVQDWEQGRVVPNNMACRFMDEIISNPPYFTQRFKESAMVVV